MFKLTKELIKILGIDPERVRLEWISSAEGTRFAEVAREFYRKNPYPGARHRETGGLIKSCQLLAISQ